VDKNGCVEVPTGPGLGVELDRDWIEKNKTGTMMYE
jgi:L-alanine-DL-glutamate epimerase-like enolase superfamily enzyme